ncbi:MAG: hypothetical protein ABSE90_06910 [Verrucomicrobiota bacterium]|jgi:hypothetical protein
MAFDSFRDFIVALDKAGELKRFSQPVATELEITEIADREMKSPGGGKALLFEKPTVNGVVSLFPVAINTRGLSSAASAANAACNTVYKLTHPTPAGDWFSVGVHSDGSYGIEKGLIFSYPIRSNGKDFEIVQGVPLNDFSRAKIAATENELKEEKSLVADLLPK